MRIIRAFLSTSILVLCFSFLSFAQPEIKFQSMQDKLPLDPDVKFGKLSNGLTYYIRYNKKPEKRAEMMLAVKTGAVMEDEDQNGLAHFTEHMCFNGTKNFKKQELINFLESIGVRFGNDVNAYTNFDETVYNFQIPTDTLSVVKKGFQVLEDWAHNVMFEDSEIDQERGVIMEEWRLGKGAEDRIQKKHNPFLFYKSKYSVHDIIGDTSIIRHAPYDVFKRYYHDWYRPDLMAIIIVGDIDPGQAEIMIKEHFGSLQNPVNERPRTEFKLTPHKEIFASVATDKELGFPNIGIYFKRDQDPDGTFDAYRKGIKTRIFESMFNNRLAELRRKPVPPFLFAGGGDGRFLGHTSIFTMFAASKGDGIATAEEAVLTETFRVYQHGFTSTELERAKTEVLRNMESAAKEKDKTESQPYAQEMIRNFLNNESMPGVVYENELFKKFVPSISLEEINSLIKDKIKTENAVITVSAPEKPDVKVPTKEEVLAIFDKVSKMDIPAYQDVVLNKPLLSKEIKPGTIFKTKEIKEIGVTEWDLSNGTKVILKPTDFKNDEILVTGFKMGGTSLLSDNDFYKASLASGVVNSCGIGEFDETMLDKYLSGKVAKFSTQIGNLSEEVDGSAAPKDLETMFQLLYLHFTAPRSDKDAFESFINKFKSQIKDSKNEPQSVFGDTVNTTMYQNHLRTQVWTEDLINQISLDKCIEFYNSRFSNANEFNFVFVGNFEPEKIKSLILKYIGGLPSTNHKETFVDNKMLLMKGKVEKKINKGVEQQSFVHMVMNGDFKFNLKERYNIEALMDILEIKLREVLREDKGGVYGVGAWDSPSRYPREQYRIDIGFGCDPQRVDELIASTLAVIKSMKDKPVENEYLLKAKEIEKREREVNLKENEFWYKALKEYYKNGDDPINILNKTKMINDLTADDIQKSAIKYLNMDNFAKFVLYPEN